jgi:hypothetical protein
MVSTRSLNHAGFAVSLLAATLFGSLFANPADHAAHATQPVLLTSAEVRLNRAGEPVGVNREAVLALAVAGSIATGVGLSAIHRQMHPNWAEEHLEPRSRRNRGAVNYPSGSQFHSASPRLQQRLVRLLHDDRAAASRLVAQAQIRYPGQSPNWYVEKVIYDLERDRGRV